MNQCYSTVMEIIESIVWVGLGFVPTLAILELVTKKSRIHSGVPLVRAAAGMRAEVEA
jgi:hypothetical protein